MAKFNTIIEAIKNSTDYGERNQFLEYILNCFNHPGSQPDEEDKALFSAFIFPAILPVGEMPCFGCVSRQNHDICPDLCHYDVRE